MAAILNIIVVALLAQLINANPVEDAEFAKYKEEHPEEFGMEFEGDMIVSDNFRNGIIEKSQLWPGGKVPYVIDARAGYSRDELANIDKAVAEYAKHTCVRWVKRSNEMSYVKIVRGTGCSSVVGMNSWNGHPQTLSLGRGCTSIGTIIHEMLHAIGFVHEQCRMDRDSHITINWHNIQQNPNMTYNFVKSSNTYISLLNTGYDYGSVMHYGPKAFSVNGRDTIVPRTRGAEIGQRRGFSQMDIQRVKNLYNCAGGGSTGGGGSVTTGCQDGHQNCAAWAKAGECNANPAYMKETCKRSCGACGEPCVDAHAHCQYWQRIGECNNNPGYMLENCKKSCRQC